jgi:hypothetical protein
MPPLPQYVFMAWCLVKHRDNFTYRYRYSYPCALIEHHTMKAYWGSGCIAGLRKIGWEGVNWMHVAQDRDHWQALVNMVINLQIL